MYAMKATLCLSILALYMLPFTMGQGTTLAITLPDFPKLAVCIAPLRDLVLPLATKLIPLAAELYKCVDFKQETNPGYKLAVILKNTYNWSKKALLEKLSCAETLVKKVYEVAKPSLVKFEANECWKFL